MYRKFQGFMLIKGGMVREVPILCNLERQGGTNWQKCLLTYDIIFTSYIYVVLIWSIILDKPNKKLRD